MNEKFWFDRRNGRWDEFDQDPFQSYYKFLRAVYQMTAREAYDLALREVRKRK